MMANSRLLLPQPARERSLVSTALGYAGGMLVMAGPWFFMVLGLGGVSAVACGGRSCAAVDLVRSVFIYNTAFSLVTGGAIAFVAARLVADDVIAGRRERLLTITLGACGAYAVIAAAIGAPFYLFTVTADAGFKVLALFNLMVLGQAWLLVAITGALKQPDLNAPVEPPSESLGGARWVAAAFALGAAAAIAGAAGSNGEAGALLNAITAGVAIASAVMFWRIVRECGASLVERRGLIAAAVAHWELAAIGFCYYVGLWADKLIMWRLAPAGQLEVAGALRTLPDYDAAMFWAQLTVAPVLGVFAVHMHNDFHGVWRGFYGRLNSHASLRELNLAVEAIQRFVLSSLVVLFAAAACIGAFAILGSFVAIDAVGLQAQQMGILRNALVGVVFHTSVMFVLVFLLYLELKRSALIVAAAFLVLNAFGTLAALHFGFVAYGLGFAGAGALAFALAIVVLARQLRWLPYHAFVTNNPSVANV